MQIIRKCSNKNYDASKYKIRKLNKTKFNSISKIIENSTKVYNKYKRSNNLEEQKLVNEKGKNSISMTRISTL